ncbi:MULTISPECIES: DivIVA domain-containing protein [unclassified Micromonospora]|uniref:DivIVA domain-containing protein n=1 Tax=unclassified Micromonospora TaxID=2617518 RepID=UPI0036263EF7
MSAPRVATSRALPPVGAGIDVGRGIPVPATFPGSAAPGCPCGEVVLIVRILLRLFRPNRSTATRRSAAAERPPDRRPPARHRATTRPGNGPPTSTPPTNSRPTAGRAASRPGPPGRHNAGHHHRSTAYPPLCARQVRQQRFGRCRRGLDPAEVDGYLRRIADELAALHAELSRTREENARIKGALRDWQSRFGPRVVRG